MSNVLTLSASFGCSGSPSWFRVTGPQRHRNTEDVRDDAAGVMSGLVSYRRLIVPLTRKHPYSEKANWDVMAEDVRSSRSLYRLQVCASNCSGLRGSEQLPASGEGVEALRSPGAEDRR